MIFIGSPVLVVRDPTGSRYQGMRSSSTGAGACGPCDALGGSAHLEGPGARGTARVSSEPRTVVELDAANRRELLSMVTTSSLGRASRLCMSRGLFGCVSWITASGLLPAGTDTRHSRGLTPSSVPPQPTRRPSPRTPGPPAAGPAATPGRPPPASAPTSRCPAGPSTVANRTWVASLGARAPVSKPSPWPR